MIRVGFFLPPTARAWLGGVSYFRNLFAAIDAAPDAGIAPIYFTPPGETAPHPVAESIPTRILRVRHPAWLARGATRRLLRRDLLLDGLLALHRIDVLTHFVSPVGSYCRPIVTWMPDFQHLHLPAMFSDAERAERDERMARASRAATRVLVSSETARADLARMIPEAANKCEVLRFVASLALTEPILGLGELTARHGIRAPYVFLPNQFWRHKNHELVIEALSRPAAAGVTVIATGHCDDYRHPGFHDQLLRRRDALGVGARFRSLGTVPFRDVVGLMMHAAAVVNPSRFEGWSTTVEEARSLGKRILLSDIPVHREQSPDRASYFGTDDADGLAELLARVVAEVDPQTEQAEQRRAAEALPGRRRDYGIRFAAIIERALSAS